MNAIEAATAKIKELKKGLPADGQSWRAVARLLDVNSYHTTQLIRHKKLTPTMYRALIKGGHLDPPDELILTEPCPTCGEVHVTSWCVYELGQPIMPQPAGKPRKRKPRFSLAAYDAELALGQLEKYYPGQFLYIGRPEEKEAEE